MPRSAHIEVLAVVEAAEREERDKELEKKKEQRSQWQKVLDDNVHRFHDLAAHGRAARQDGSPDEAARCFRPALAWWRGPALADLVRVAAQHGAGRLQRLAEARQRQSGRHSRPYKR